MADDPMNLSDDALYELALAMDFEEQANSVDRKENEEQHLSQKLSQLSASHKQEQHLDKQLNQNLPSKRSPDRLELSTLPKRRKTIDEQTIVDVDANDSVPNYLSIQQYNSFQQLIRSMLSTTASSMQVSDLHEITLLIRRIMVLDLQKSLWNIYLQSGTGQLASEAEQEELCLWPMEVKSTMTTDNNEIDQMKCLNYVNQTLEQFLHRQRYCEQQLEEKKYHFQNCFTTEMEDTLRQFIEQQELVFMRLDCERKMTIVKYDYRDRLLELEYRQLKPTKYQLEAFENLSQAKQEKEKSKYEFELMKQRAQYGYLPEPLQSLQLPLSTSFNQITDPQIRQILLDAHMNTNKQTKVQAMEIYLRMAEVQMRENQMKFDQDISRIKSSDRPLTLLMVDVIEKRFRTIDERLQHLFNLKIRFLEEQTKQKKPASFNVSR